MKLINLLLLFYLFSFSVCGQQRYRVVSYNVENLYDTRNDPKTLDDDFTPTGKMHWTESKYTDKLLKLAQAIEGAGEGELPAFVGLCEVENRRVVEDLATKGVLAGGNYGIVHKDSPDRRGIDVALLYRKSCFRPLKELFFPVPPEDTSMLTRDILYTAGILGDKDTLHLFVCHFPSMSGGEMQSEWKRKRAATVVKAAVDSIQRQNSKAAILIMGDLNGLADREAQKEVLGTMSSDSKRIKEKMLYNTGYYLLNKNEGSYKYRGNWQTIDHMIVSGALLNGKNAFHCEKHLKPFAASYLLEEDKRNYGFQPFRTYLGPRYHGGYSDHLPIYLDLLK